MIEKTLFPYKPDYSVHPGEYLEEVLESRGIKKREAADRLSISVKTISQIINKKAYITPDMAIQFERVLGISANIWNNMSSDYRLHEARRSENSRLEKDVIWIEQFPIKDLKKRGFLPDTTNKEVLFGALLSFFGVSSPVAWNTHYNKVLKSVCCKKSVVYDDNLPHLASWIREGELRAQSINTGLYSKKIFKKNLDKIRLLTVERVESFLPKLVNLCAEAGVAVVFVPECGKTHIWGITRWISAKKALIILSLRYKTNDHLWFPFFHEAGHILLHGKKFTFIENRKEAKTGKITAFKQEEQANEFASNILIPEIEYKSFVNAGFFSPHSIDRFAKKVNIHRGIVVGRLEHDGVIRYGRFQHFKEKFIFVESNQKQSSGA
jgi:HTH-type transcriptional regulator/antitoxin HigA